MVSSSQDEGKEHLSVLEIYKIEAVMCLFQTIFHEVFGRHRQENQEFEDLALRETLSLQHKKTERTLLFIILWLTVSRL